MIVPYPPVGVSDVVREAGTDRTAGKPPDHRRANPLEVGRYLHRMMDRFTNRVVE